MDKILILVDNIIHSEMIGQWLSEVYQVFFGHDDQCFTQEFDVILVDGPSLLKFGDKLREMKQSEAVVFVPVVLVTTNRDANLLTNQIWQVVDEIVIAPLRKSEFFARMRVLLRARHQSIEIDRLKQNKINEVNSRLDMATKAANVGLFDLDLKNNTMFLSREMKSQIGCENVEITDLYGDLKNRLHPEDRDRVLKLYEDLRKNSRKTFSVEYRLRHEDGSYRWILSQGSVLSDENGNPSRVLGARIDVTDKKLSQEMQERLVIAIESAAESVVITDSDGRITYVNPAFEEVTGYSRDEVMGQNPRILQSGEHDQLFYRNVWETISSDKIWKGLFKNKRKDGSTILHQSTIAPVKDSNGAIVAYVSVKRDITQERLLQDQLIQSQKMEAIGTLAGGIAHDFNNILYTISGSAELALSHSTPDSALANNLNRILKSAERASDMVKQILTFSRQSDGEKQHFNPSHIIAEGLKLLRGAIPTNINIHSQLQPNLPNIQGDPTQVYQILMNLCTNAAHAMKQNGGNLTVELCEKNPAPELLESGDDSKDRDYVCLTVSDDGEGIPRGIINRIFEPYFTTKEVGEGTGLGLSVLHGIIQSFGGAVTVWSEPGKGSRFDVYFPVTVREEATDTTNQEDFLAPVRGKVLWVDDEKMLLDMVSQTLDYLGFEVVACLCPKKAIEIFSVNPESYDVVVTDLTMPEMSGFELARKITDIRPGTPLIICTGHGASVLDPEMDDSGVCAVLQKPVKRGELAIAIQKALTCGSS